MPPKKGNKKLKDRDDDARWAGKETSIPGLEALQDDFEPPKAQSSSSFAAIASLNGDEADPFAGEEMGGGLMGAIQANLSKKGKKKDKKNTKGLESPNINSPSSELPPSTPNNEPRNERTADELAAEEWAIPEKKGKGKLKTSLPPSRDAPTPVDDNANDGDADVDDGQGSRPLSKKEKEKLKKERDKAKKKAQAQAKKAETGAPDANETSTSSTLPADVIQQPPTPSPAAAVVDEEEDEDGVEAGAKSDKKKKKKKKPAAAQEKEPPKKKVAPGIAALRALQEQQRAAEEEALKKAEEERLRLEEEERRAAEEERLKEEAKQRRKEKEKAKKELARKEGRLLTDKQKKERAQAEVARQALLASGVRIEGLERAAEPATAPKRVIYGNKKKKPAQTSAAGLASASSEPSTPDVSLPPPLPNVTEVSLPKDVADPTSPAVDVPDDVKDEWDVSTDEEGDSPSSTPAIVSNGNASKPLAKPVSGPTASKPSAAKVSASNSTPSTKATQPPKPTIAIKDQTESGTEGSESASDVSDATSGSGSDSDDSSDEDSDSDEELTVAQRQALLRKAEAAERRALRHEEAMAARSKDNLRSPICCILGHVDTGKTKLLDKIRQTNVQEGEAGGITQQIGATYFPVDAIKEKTAVMNRDGSQQYNIPGLLVIDTPGHESFTNLRSRGSSLCNIAVLVVDIMHGLEPQTLESLRLLRDKKTPFVVALNKIDRMYGWEPTPDGAFRESLAKQKPAVQREFERRYEETVVAFAEQGLNAVLYYDNKSMAKNVSVVPTSAITGEGVPDMIMLLVHLTQTRMSDRLMYLSELECTILEVKIIEGLGTTIDVVLSNGVLHEGDKIVLCGLNGPIVTTIRALLTPQPMRELRIKSAYVHHKEVKAALGVKITATDLDKAIAGSRLMVCGPDDDEEDLKEEVMSDLTNLLSSVDRSGRGVSVQASTLGSLEALLEFLKVSKIPVASIGLGPVHKRDIMQAAIMVERAKELACVLCFDVTVDKDAEKIAEEYGIKLFKADIIYHLFDAFTAYNAEIVEAKRKDAAPQAIWPCRLKIIAMFTKRDPIILGVDIIDGTLRVGTPLCVVKVDATTGKRDIISLGKITSLEINHKSMDIVKKSQAGGGVAVKIEHAVYQSSKMYGRHFDDKDELLSHITRQSIDVLKETFRNDMTKEDVVLIKGLKQRLGID